MNVNTCVSILTEIWGLEEEGTNVDVGETYEAFCNGTGTKWGETFQEWLVNGYLSSVVLSELENANIINKSVETVNASVTYIGYEAFHNKSLTSVIIPSSVTKIDDFAFFRNQLTCVDVPVTTHYSSSSFSV